nr:immunoglobulin heavy chain junction region [Macaca mulatta]MOX65588.1 immunoglobulin heavy chain junction region [Macaca mulatta]
CARDEGEISGFRFGYW